MGLPSGSVPLMTERSEWQTPVAPIFTRSSPALGGSSLTSSIAYWFRSRVTSAFIAFLLAACAASSRPYTGPSAATQAEAAPALVDSENHLQLGCRPMR